MVEASGLAQNMPKGWHIRTLPTNKGDVRVEVVHGVAREGCQPTAVEADLQIDVPYDLPPAPWWRFWDRPAPFEARFGAAVQRCKKRAWELNESKNRAKRLIYEMESRAHAESVG